jgi:protein required for attachment to host cells
MKESWIVVANAAQASIFASPGPIAKAEFKEALQNPTGRLSGRDINTDKSGSARSDSGKGGGQTLAPAADPKETEVDKFGQVLAGRVNQAIASGEIDRVALVMAPRVLGRVRAHLSGPAEKAITWSSDKDIANHKTSEILEKIKALRP